MDIRLKSIGLFEKLAPKVKLLEDLFDDVACTHITRGQMFDPRMGLVGVLSVQVEKRRFR